MSGSWMDVYLRDSLASMQAFCSGPAYRGMLADMAVRIEASLRAGGKLLIAGNGGSAGDAQHIAGEFVGRLIFDRAPLAAIALTTDSSVMTALANDYGYAAVFERQVRALGRPGDVVLGLSTSGRSPNVLAALSAARAGGMVTLGFCGAEAEPMAGHADIVLAAPSARTAVVQQIHITAGHVVCGLVERAMFPDAAPGA